MKKPTLVSNRALVHDLATGRFLAEKVAVLIVGPCGTGKPRPFECPPRFKVCVG